MLVGEGRGHAALRGAFHETDLDEVGFVNLFQGLALFTNGHGERGKAHGAPAEFLDDGVDDQAIHVVKAQFVNAEQLQRGVGHLARGQRNL